MDTRDAYTAILKALGADSRKHVVACGFDEENFGNFAITFEVKGRPRTLINDRGELSLSHERTERGGRTILQSIHEADERTLLQALQQ
ncbi:MAG TPA: hypothetical protein VF619_02440 [Allosphingosinicella sp.]